MSSSASSVVSEETTGSGSGEVLSASFETSRLATHSSRTVDASRSPDLALDCTYCMSPTNEGSRRDIGIFLGTGRVSSGSS
eukprot:816100-Amphidinium_carterae.1